MSKVTHLTPKLAIDPVLLNRKLDDNLSIERQNLYKEELDKIKNLHFNKRGLMPLVDEQKMAQVMTNSEDLIRLIKDNSFEHYFTGNVWIEDKIMDSYQLEAREILQYEEDLVGHFKSSDLREDPILRAHAQISIKEVVKPKVLAFLASNYIRLSLKSQLDISKERVSKYCLTFKNYWKKIKSILQLM